MTNEIIEVTQLPVIVEHLQVIKTQVAGKVQTALNLVCDETTIQEVKKMRAELSKEFNAFEERRKYVKNAVLSPYEQFEAVYKDCITNGYKTADSELKAKIDAVENELKAQKRIELIEYFDEYVKSKNINIPLSFEDGDIYVTLSASMKKLKEQTKAFVDRVVDDLALIDTQQYKSEILVEYQENQFNVSGAISKVIKRHKAIDEMNALKEEQKAKEQAQAEAVAKVEAIAPPTVEEETLTVAFTVTATKTKLKALKEFLKQGEYKYE